jgi:hypothetical protein
MFKAAVCTLFTFGSGVLVEELGGVLGDAGRLVDLGGVGALLA